MTIYDYWDELRAATIDQSKGQKDEGKPQKNQMETQDRGGRLFARLAGYDVLRPSNPTIHDGLIYGVETEIRTDFRTEETKNIFVEYESHGTTSKYIRMGYPFTLYIYRVPGKLNEFRVTLVDAEEMRKGLKDVPLTQPSPITGNRGKLIRWYTMEAQYTVEETRVVEVVA